MRVAVLLIMLLSTAYADRNKAEQLFNRGERAYRAQKFLAAAQAFEAAYKELPAPELAFSIAQAYRRQYRIDPSHTEYVELAVRYYELYLKEVKRGGRTGDAADYLDAMKAELRHLERSGKLNRPSAEQKPQLGVYVDFADRRQTVTAMREVDDARPTVAEVAVTAMIDGKVVEPDVLHDVGEGDHVVRAEAPGYKPAEKRVRVIAGAPAYVPLELEPIPAQLTVDTEEGAMVSVDGRGIGQAPDAKTSLAAGTHVVTVTRSGRKPVAQELIVDRAQTKTLKVELEPTLRRRAVKWVALSAGALAIVASTAAGGAIYWNETAQDKRDRLLAGDQTADVLADYNRARSRRDTALTGVWVMGSAAVAVGLTAAWLYYFDTPSAEGVRVIPAATTESAGAVISAHF